MADRYEVRRADRAVIAWSTRRLPFEPTGPMVELRTELRAALSAMSPAHGRPLHAVYASTDRSHCDLENVLVYNVGARPFNRIARDGLALERRFDVRALTFQPDSAPPDAHWMRYDVGSPEMPAAWRDSGTLAAWDQPGWPRLSSSTRAATVWYRLSGGDIDAVSNPGTPEHLGIELDVTRPLATDVNPASIIKPLIDGILAALCRHDGTRLDIVAERLADQLPADAEDIGHRLTSRDHSVLGPCALVRPYRAGVQWYPPDDRLVSITLRMHGHRSSDWRVTGRLFMVAPAVESA